MLMRLLTQYFIICLFQLGELALGLKFSLQKGPTFRGDDWVLEGNWLTFLRLKALSSSFSTAWMFLTLITQRASFPGKQKNVNNNRQRQSQVLMSCFRLFVFVKQCAPLKMRKYKRVSVN